MWLKVTLLLIYLAVLFMLARFLEALTWYEQGQLSRKFLDPMTLSVLKLKALLEQRGVSYDNVVEKSELTELVEATGSVSEEETVTTSVLLGDQTTITNFTGSLDFFEQVEDAKDSMWLVEVITDTGGLLSQSGWNAIQQKVGMFGVRFGRFHCEMDIRLCTRKQWFSTRLVLALPESHETKANVVLRTYPGTVRVHSIFDWIKSHVNGQIHSIESEKVLRDDWLTYKSSISPEVRVIFVSTLSTLPLFLSALSVKFPGRVKVGSINTRTESGRQLAKRGDIKMSPSYVVIMAEWKYIYGNKHGETFTFRSLELFLKSLHPSLNDIFIVSMFLTNVASLFEISLVSGNIIKRFMRLLFCLFKYNMFLLLGWILLLTLFQLPLTEYVALFGLKLLRICTSSTLFSYIRNDLLVYARNPSYLAIVFVSMATAVRFIKVKCFANSSEDSDESDWWNFRSLQTLDYEQWWELTRLRPFDQIFNPTFGVMNVGMDSPDHEGPFVSKEYIQHLPTWKYRDLESCKLPDNQDTCEILNNSAVGCKTKQKYLDRYANKGVKQGRITNIVSTSQLANEIMDGNYSCECLSDCKCPPANGCRNPTINIDNLGPLEASVAGSSPAISQIDTENENPFTDFPECYRIETLNQQKSKPHGFMESSQCVICLDNYDTLALLRGLPCGHVFHDKCIIAWLMRDNHFCPVCRWPSYKPKPGITLDRLHTE